MTHALYTYQQLQLKSIARLKQIYSEIACTVEVNDKRCKDAWISAIVNYQVSKIQKLSPTAPDEQAAAQAELDNYIADQAQTVAPKPLKIVEISFDHHEYYADDKLVASSSILTRCLMLCAHCRWWIHRWLNQSTNTCNPDP